MIAHKSSVAKQLERRTCNPKAPNIEVPPWLLAEFVLGSLKSKFSAILVQ